MIGNEDSYYLRPECSNSDFTKLDSYFKDSQWVMDLTTAFRMGNLVDAMITEQHRVDHYRMMVDQEQFTKEEWDQCMKMYRVGEKDPIMKQMMIMCNGQAIKVREIELEYCGFKFKILMRCKFDFWSDALNWGAELKTTAATTQKGFEEACYHFNYDRACAVYMNIAESERHMIMGISKVNHKIFKIAVNRESEFYKSGMEKFREIAFKHWTLFDNLIISS